MHWKSLSILFTRLHPGYDCAHTLSDNLKKNTKEIKLLICLPQKDIHDICVA